MYYYLRVSQTQPILEKQNQIIVASFNIMMNQS